MSEQKATRLRIVSDGTPRNTRIETEDGTLVRGVQNVVWMLETGGAARLTIDVLGVAANVMGLVEEPDASLLQDPDSGFVLSEPQEPPEGFDFPPTVPIGYRCSECGAFHESPEVECTGSEEMAHAPVLVNQDPEVIPS